MNHHHHLMHLLNHDKELNYQTRYMLQYILENFQDYEDIPVKIVDNDKIPIYLSDLFWLSTCGMETLHKECIRHFLRMVDWEVIAKELIESVQLRHNENENDNYDSSMED